MVVDVWRVENMVVHGVRGVHSPQAKDEIIENSKKVCLLAAWDNSTSTRCLLKATGGQGIQEAIEAMAAGRVGPWTLRARPGGLERFQPRLDSGAPVAGAEPSHRRLK